MPTLLLPPRYTEDSIALWRAAIAASWDVERVPWRLPDPERTRDRPSAYGEHLFVAAVAEQVGFAVIEPPLDFLPGLPARHRRRRVELTTMGAARQRTSPAFIKPAQQKAFPAGVVVTGDDLPRAIDDAAPVLVSQIVRFRLEVRCFVLDRRIATWSIYARDGDRADALGGWIMEDAERDAALGFAAALLGDADVALPPAVVIDVGETDQGWAVVEANPAASAGIYGADPARVLDVVARACPPRDELSDEDRRWVMNG